MFPVYVVILIIRIDYLAELSLTPAQWFRRKSDTTGGTALSFDDPTNTVRNTLCTTATTSLTLPTSSLSHSPS